MAKKGQSRRRKAQSSKGKPVTAQLPRPTVTEFTRITVVPVFVTGPAGPPSGSRGEYKVTFVLGVPGVSSVATEAEFEKVLGSGDSLLAGAGMRAQIALEPNAQPDEFVFSSNRHGRLDRVEVTVTGDGFASAERWAHDRVMPVLSRMAVEADVPVEVKATAILEVSTQNRQLGAMLIGAVKTAPTATAVLTPSLRPLLAAYREGLNCNMSSYQALAFYKIIEGVDTFATKERRRAQQQGQPIAADPLASIMPMTLAGVPDGPPWSKDRFVPFLGKSFREVKDSYADVIRNAVAHLTPGRDLRVPDYMEDVEKCREAAPILRYVARELTLAEMKKSPGWKPPPQTSP